MAPGRAEYSFPRTSKRGGICKTLQVPAHQVGAESSSLAHFSTRSYNKLGFTFLPKFSGEFLRQLARVRHIPSAIPYGHINTGFTSVDSFSPLSCTHLSLQANRRNGVTLNGNHHITHPAIACSSENFGLKEASSGLRLFKGLQDKQKIEKKLHW